MSEAPTTGSPDRVALVTGVTGYIGSHVAQRLLDEGWRVRALVRDADKVPTELRDRIDVIEGDAHDEDSLGRALAGATAAWFLIHSMGGQDDFAEQDRAIAEAFARAAKTAGVRRIVYLGGLHPDSEELSAHLASRVEVGEILMASGVPTAAVQAGVVLGDGSASFDMLRTLSERLPGSIGPQWLRNKIQPIHVDDVVHYLVRAADLPASQNRSFDVGGPDVLTYADMMARYATVKKLGPRPSLTVPVMTPRLASLWISLVTPIDAAMARPLVESLHHDNLVHEHDLDELVGTPPGGPLGFDAAVAKASANRDEKRWLKVAAAAGGAVALTAVLGSVATIPNAHWFKRLDKPTWQPPNSAFGPVWSALYADITLVSALHLTDLFDADDEAAARDFAAALGLNLALNAGWSWIFWQWRNLPMATLEAAALAISSADLVRRVGKRRERGVVLSPYAAWTAFATALTAELWRRNR